MQNHNTKQVHTGTKKKGHNPSHTQEHRNLKKPKETHIRQKHFTQILIHTCRGIATPPQVINFVMKAHTCTQNNIITRHMLHRPT